MLAALGGALTGSNAASNALFMPLKHRVKIVQFDPEQTNLDEGATRAVEQAWGDQKGASFFFVVARASPDGAADVNQQLSQSRAESVLTHDGPRIFARRIAEVLGQPATKERAWG